MRYIIIIVLGRITLKSTEPHYQKNALFKSDKLEKRTTFKPLKTYQVYVNVKGIAPATLNLAYP